jgi:hypothetical protein
MLYLLLWPRLNSANTAAHYWYHQVKVPFGDAVVSTADTCIGVELCEELFTPARSVSPWSVPLTALSDQKSPYPHGAGWRRNLYEFKWQSP